MPDRPVEEAPAKEQHWLADLRDGLQFVRRTPLIRGLLIVFGFQAIGFSVMPVLQILWVDRVLHLPPSAFGYIMSVFAVGMLAGGALIAALGERIPETRLIVIAACGYGLLFILIAFATWLPLIFALVALLGICEAATAVAVPTLLQHTVPDELRGRVFSVQNVVLTALNIVGMGAAGIAAELAPVQAIMVVGGAVSLCGGIIGFAVLRESHARAARAAVERS